MKAKFLKNQLQSYSEYKTAVETVLDFAYLSETELKEMAATEEPTELEETALEWLKARTVVLYDAEKKTFV